ncbi:MAG TPA: MCP four helix bundle domain-containing protein, partial [Pyrinomonadaceae bacterium]|nr:MCP four helix bundle domain-containing protein [Pyrinomonadaceae bacterium]
MKISHKLILCFLCVAAFSFLTTIFTLNSYDQINSSFTRLIRDPTRMARALSDIKIASVQIIFSTTEYAFIEVGSDGSAETERANKEEHSLQALGYEAFETTLKRYEDLAGEAASDKSATVENVRSGGRALIK